MYNEFWLGWPYTKWANRYACCKAPFDKSKQQEIIKSLYYKEIEFPSEEEIRDLSEKRWLATDNKCGKTICKSIALNIDGGYFPFENNPTNCCPGCGQPVKNLPIKPLKDSGWISFNTGRCITKFNRSIQFDRSVIHDEQLLCISWIRKHDNPGYYAWHSKFENEMWRLSTEMDSSD